MGKVLLFQKILEKIELESLKSSHRASLFPSTFEGSFGHTKLWIVGQRMHRESDK